MIYFVLFLVCQLPQVVDQARAGEDGSGPWPVPVNKVAMLDRDDQGGQLRFPSAVFYDSAMKEIYLISSGRIIIYGTEYGSSFFPVISLGKGRGVDRPIGLLVAGDGRLFICQGRSREGPARLTILNAALFPLREIVISDIPGAESFTPSRVALGRKDRIYLAGKGFRGVMVLDSQGEFLHWLKPEDRMLRKAGGESGQMPGDREGDSPDSLSGRDMSKGDDAVTGQDPEAEEIKVGPVQVHDVLVSESGNIFLLSEETGKVYIYDDREEFIFSFGQKGGSSGKLSRPRGLAVNEEKQSIFVVDYMRHTILAYNFAGRFLFEIGGQGRGPGWFNYPTDIALTDRGYLVVADLFNHRVQVLEVEFAKGSVLFGPGEED